MKIISKFKDYYDSGQALDQEREDVFVREYSCLENEKEFLKVDRRLAIPLLQDDYQVIHVCFCGKVYAGVKLFYKVNEKLEQVVVYTDKQLKTALEKYGIKEIKQGKQRWVSRRFFTKPIGSLDEYSKYVSSFNPIDIHRRFKSPIVIQAVADNYHKPAILVNPILREFEFQKVMNPQIAWQEISMFYFGVLGYNEKPMIQISDSDMKWKKGFDNWSFKKLPTKKK